MPSYPYQRFLEQLCREGRDTESVLQALNSLGFAPPTSDEIQDLRVSLVNTPNDDIFSSDDLRMSLVLLSDDEAVDYIKGYSHILDDDELVDVIKKKFGIIITVNSLVAFKEAFWNLSGMSHMDAILYFNRSDEMDKPAEAVPDHQVTQFYAWEAGEEVELSRADIFSQLETDAYFKYRSSLAIATPTSQQEARKWGDFLMKVVKERAAYNKASATPITEERQAPELVYDDGDSPPPTIDEIQQPEE